MIHSPLHAKLITAPNVVNLKDVNNSFQIGVSNAGLEEFFIHEGDELHFWFIISDNPANHTADRPWGLTSADYFIQSKCRCLGKGDGTNLSSDDYIGIVAGYKLTESQIDSNRVINSLYFDEDTAGDHNLILFANMNMDAENKEMILKVYGLFIKKTMI